MSWTESISIAIKDDDVSDYFNKMFNIILRLFTALAIGMIACMPFVFPIMINEKFSDGYGLVPISIIGSLFNVVVGLCVGHDSLFYKYTHTLTTTLVTKDRVLAHNPVGALYQTKAYYKKLMTDPASGEKVQ